MKSRCAPLVLAALVAGNALANNAEEILALEADSEYGEYLAGECSACHNPNTADGSAVPQIHGVEALTVIEKLLAYRDGTLENTTMQGIAVGLADDEIAAIAAYLSGFKAD